MSANTSVRRFPAAALAAIVASTTIAAGPPALAAAAPANCPAAVSGVTSAPRLARACGHRVELADRRTEQARTFANPDGSYTYETSAAPRFVKRSDGTWADIDTTLRRQPNGSVVAAAVRSPLTLSGGGSAPLVSIRTAAGPWSLSWPASLPAPRLDGDSAVYADVFAGVDLRVRAMASGFSYVLVVRTREALADPRLLRIALHMSGPALRPRGDGSAEALGPDGTPLLSTGGALMWDSSTAAGPTGSSASPNGPGVGARGAPVIASVSGQDLVLMPDPAMLADPAVVLPLYIDPQVAGRNRWAYADSTDSNRDDGIARVGLNPDGSGTYRSFFEFPTGAVAGTHILAASFDTTLTHSWSCGNSPVSLYWTGGIPGGVNGTRISWGTALLQWLDEQANHAHKPSTGSGCAGDPQPDQPMRFNNLLTGKVQEWANAGVGAVTLGLSTRGGDGSNENAADRWKKFSVSATFLVINYNSVPGTPDPAALAAVGTSQSVPCYTGAAPAAPRVNATGGVRLRATLTDNDAGTNVLARFEWQDLTAGAGVTAVPDTPGFPSPHTFEVALSGSAVPNGHQVRWRVHGWDGTDNGGVSAWCLFTVDNATPGQPVLTSTDLPAFPAPGPAATAVVGRPAAVTLTPAAGDTDVVGYFYSVGPVDTPPTIWVAAATAGTPTVIPVVPVVSGLAKNFLSVIAVDGAGNRSPVALSAPDAAGTRQFRANPAEAASRVANDATGDGRADVTLASDVGGGMSALWRWTSGANGALTAAVAPAGNTGTYANGSFLTAGGDFDGDGLSDTAAFTQSGSTVVLTVQRSDRNQLFGTPTLQPMPGWSIGKMKVAGGDFDGDGDADLAVAYDMGSLNWNIYVLRSTSTPGAMSFAAPVAWYQYPANTSDPSRVKFLAGDFNGDGRSDVAELYDYGSAQTKLWVHWSQVNDTFSGAVLQWDSGQNAWLWSDSNFVAGDFTGDGKTDIAAIYAPNHTFNGTIAMAMFSAKADGSGLNGPSTQWTSPANAYDWNGVTGYAGDYNGDGRGDLALLYRCCGPYQAQVWISTSTGAALPAPEEAVSGGIGPAGIASVSIDTFLGPNQARYQLENVNSHTCAEVGTDNLLRGQPCSTSTAQYYTVERRGGQYVSIHPAGTSGCVDVVNAATADTTLIQQTGCHGVATATYMLAQYWTIEYLTGLPSAVTVRLTTPLSGKCFDLDNGRSAPNTTIWEYTCNGGTAQQWLLRRVS